MEDRFTPLATLYAKQRQLQERLGYHFDTMTEAERVHYVKDMVLALTDELHEALAECTGWKPWATVDHDIDREKYVGELVDCLHFLMNLFLVVNTPVETIIERYLRKNKVNHQRQDDGYDGKNKCVECQRELDGGPPVIIVEGERFCSPEHVAQWQVRKAALEA